MLTAVEHIHHWNGKHVCVDATDVAIERDCEIIGSSSCYCERNSKDCIRSEPALVVSSIKFDKYSVDVALIECIETNKRVVDFVVDVSYSIEYALTHVTTFTVAKLDGLERPGGCA